MPAIRQELHTPRCAQWSRIRYESLRSSNWPGPDPFPGRVAADFPEHSDFQAIDAGQGRQGAMMLDSAMNNFSARPGCLPLIIQGGMGVGVSNWRLARAVAQQGQLG